MRKALLIISLALVGGLTLLLPASATTDVTMETFWAASGGQTSGGSEDGINFFWHLYNYPTIVTPTLTANTVSAWVWGGSPPASMAEGHYAHYAWTSTNSGSTITAGGVLYAGVPFRRYANQSTGNIEVKVRVAVNELRRLDDFKIYLEDDDSRQASSSVIGSLSSGNMVVVAATFDLSASPFSSSATDNLRAYIEAKGLAADDANHDAGNTEVDIEYIAVRQYDD